MADPITIGALVATALSMAAEATLKGAVGEAAKDAYKKLKDAVARWTGNDVEALEKNPTSTNVLLKAGSGLCYRGLAYSFWAF